MTLGALARSGAFLRACRMLHLGEPYIEVLLKLRREFVMGTDIQYHTIIRTAEKAVAAARKLQDPKGDGIVTDADIPVTPW